MTTVAASALWTQTACWHQSRSNRTVIENSGVAQDSNDLSVPSPNYHCHDHWAEARVGHSVD
ncbi:hypothetical protein HanIR_Chr03g0126021 [Helianthus annuus]|nr:hypothetical protein HanIR_Chr03g0126021 [Helianthus annuus]